MGVGGRGVFGRTQEGKLRSCRPFSKGKECEARYNEGYANDAL